MKNRTLLNYIFFVIPWLIVSFVLVKIVPAFALSKDWKMRLFLLEHAFDSLLPIQMFTITYVVIALFTVAYLASIYYFSSSRKEYRPGEEYGDASWGNIRVVNQKIQAKNSTQNLLLSKRLRLDLDTWQHGRNTNVIVVGGSGSGKTRGYVKPNLLQGNTSYVVLDPAGEILRDSGNALLKMGYTIRVVDLVNMEQSDCYNPFSYIRTDNDVFILITSLIKNTTPPGSATSDPFWEKAEIMLTSALVLLLHKYGAPHEKTFKYLMVLLSEAKGDTSSRNILDELFEYYEAHFPGNLASLTYHRFKTGAEKTLQSIIITASARLTKFDLPSLQRLTEYDEMEFETFGSKKTALFIKTPIVDSSFNFMAGMIYTQLFQALYDVADKTSMGHLEIPVHVMMDEFANVKLPEDFEQILSTCRKHWISISIILQNISQLKAIYQKQWESIIGNCDSFIYLGGNEQSTHEYISKALGKETIRTKTYQTTKGARGSSSTNLNQMSHDLMSPDQVRRLHRTKSIVMIRGERPIMDEKFELKKHPHIEWTADGGGNIYVHERKKKNGKSIIPSMEFIA